MENRLEERILNLKLQGYCCSQIIMGLGLENLERKNPDLIAAMSGLCNGLEEGKLCGTLAAAVCLLFLVDAKAADRELRGELMDWFCDRFGGYDCAEILDGNPAARLTVCPVMIAETWEMVLELLDGKL